MALDLITLGSSKVYTNMVALGLSDVTVNDKTGTVTFLLNDGSSATYTFPKPKDGVSVTGVEQISDDKFVLTLSDGNITEPITTVKGEKGDTGKTGPKGDKGNDGYSPVKGVDYWTESDKNEIQSYIDSQIGGALNDTY